MRTTVFSLSPAAMMTVCAPSAGAASSCAQAMSAHKTALILDAILLASILFILALSERIILALILVVILMILVQVKYPNAHALT